MRVGRFGEAVPFLERTDPFGSSDPAYARNLTLSQLRAGHASDAVRVADQALVLTDLQRYDEALAELDRHIRQTNAPGARLLRSAVLRRAGRSDEAMGAVRDLLRERPDDLAVQGAMVRTAIEDGDPDALLEATEDLVAEDRSGLVLYLRAIALHTLGRTAAAVEALDAASKLAPSDPAIGALRERFEEARRAGRGT
jgi:tetratricopeptide (TPR) repeat protein